MHSMVTYDPIQLLHSLATGDGDARLTGVRGEPEFQSLLKILKNADRPAAAQVKLKVTFYVKDTHEVLHTESIDSNDRQPCLLPISEIPFRAGTGDSSGFNEIQIAIDTFASRLLDTGLNLISTKQCDLHQAVDLGQSFVVPPDASKNAVSNNEVELLVVYAVHPGFRTWILQVLQPSTRQWEWEGMWCWLEDPAFTEILKANQASVIAKTSAQPISTKDNPMRYIDSVPAPIFYTRSIGEIFDKPTSYEMAWVYPHRVLSERAEKMLQDSLFSRTTISVVFTFEDGLAIVSAKSSPAAKLTLQDGQYVRLMDHTPGTLISSVVQQSNFAVEQDALLHVLAILFANGELYKTLAEGNHEVKGTGISYGHCPVAKKPSGMAAAFQGVMDDLIIPCANLVVRMEMTGNISGVSAEELLKDDLILISNNLEGMNQVKVAEEFSVLKDWFVNKPIIDITK